MTFLIWLKSVTKRGYAHLLIWNAFDSRSSDPTIIRRELFTTRLYLILLLLLSVGVLAAYTSFSVRFKSETVDSPTYSQYEKLQEKYSDSLQCSCTKISMSYGGFVRTSPRFHQVCSSDFITQKWIDFTFPDNLILLSPIDIRMSLSAVWKFIQSFCRNADQITSDIRNQFANTSLINPTLLNKDLLIAKTQSTLSSIRQIETVRLIQSVKIVDRVIRANSLLTALGNNYVLRAVYENQSSDIRSDFYIEIYRNQYIQNNSKKVCICENDRSCPLPANIYLYNITDRSAVYDMNTIPSNGTLLGLVVDCLPLQMTFASTFECFYQQSCLNFLLSTYQQKINISILNSSQPSRFHLTATIDSIFNELFLEEIYNETNYEDYYLPMRQPSNETFLNRLKRILQKIKQKIVSLNIYTKYSHDETSVRHGRLSTRLYFLLLFLSIIIMVIYSSVLAETITEQVINPTLNEYIRLQVEHSSTLRCPCSQMSVMYRDFVEIKVKYHQICLSDFVQPWWYQSFSFPKTSSQYILFIWLGLAYFETLATFCELVDETVKNGVEQYLSTTFVNGYVLSNDSFHIQMTSLINSFIGQLENEFIYRLSLTKLFLQSNQYMSYLPLSTYPVIDRGYAGSRLLYLNIYASASYTYKDSSAPRCFCVLDSSCSFDD
ncbi:unnamed protein product [Adineta ricciae]|uniref:Uncharacterized protein n=1 Tax=Adineta ricciae TaxID=249248 RepID=A0A815S242_ADIRI|nr:unnamed protein product [Adineta ricciae]